MIDRGGTFTGIVALSPQDELFTDKVLSEDLKNYDDAAIEGIRRFFKVDKIKKFLVKKLKL